MKVVRKTKTRTDISNPYNKLSHKQLLKAAKVKSFKGQFKIIDIGNGRIRVSKK